MPERKHNFLTLAKTVQKLLMSFQIVSGIQMFSAPTAHCYSKLARDAVVGKPQTKHQMRKSESTQEKKQFLKRKSLNDAKVGSAFGQHVVGPVTFRSGKLLHEPRQLENVTLGRQKFCS